MKPGLLRLIHEVYCTGIAVFFQAEGGFLPKLPIEHGHFARLRQSCAGVISTQQVRFLSLLRLNDKPNVLFTHEVFRAYVILLLAVSVHFIDG
jgi:hypothetical protein